MVDRNSYEPLYQQIKRDIEEQILSGKIQIGDKLMSESEMLSCYSVGRMTVRAALAAMVSNGCLKKERGRGTYVIAKPKQAARFNIDVLVNTSDADFIPYFLTGISRALDKHDCNILLHNTMDSLDTIESILALVLQRGSNGILLQPETSLNNTTPNLRELLNACTEADIPIVTMDGKIRDMDVIGFMTDDVLGGRLAAQCLIDLGHRNIVGLFRNQFRDSSFRARGYSEAMKDAGLTPQLIDADSEYQAELCDLIQSGSITGIVCYNDYLVAECYHSFLEQGIRVPQDVSVVGYDDTETAMSTIPRITSITHPKDHMGEDAANCLMQLIHKEPISTRLHLYTPTLVTRASTRSL